MDPANSPPPRSEAAAAPRPNREAFALSRLRRSPVLKACMLLAFVEYGALAVFAIFGNASRGASWPLGSFFPLAGWLAICSLGSWFFLFLWFPFLQKVQRGDPSAQTMGRVLEGVAIACVAVVHAMLALILVQAL